MLVLTRASFVLAFLERDFFRGFTHQMHPSTPNKVDGPPPLPSHPVAPRIISRFNLASIWAEMISVPFLCGRHGLSPEAAEREFRALAKQLPALLRLHKIYVEAHCVATATQITQDGLKRMQHYLTSRPAEGVAVAVLRNRAARPHVLAHLREHCRTLFSVKSPGPSGTGNMESEFYHEDKKNSPRIDHAFPDMHKFATWSQKFDQPEESIGLREFFQRFLFSGTEPVRNMVVQARAHLPSHDPDQRLTFLPTGEGSFQMLHFASLTLLADPLVCVRVLTPLGRWLRVSCGGSTTGGVGGDAALGGDH